MTPLANLLLILLSISISYSQKQTCMNYNNYTTTNGTDTVLNITSFITYVPMNNNSTEIRTTAEAQFISKPLDCTNPNGCSYYCQHPISCLLTQLHCNSSIGCNIICTARDSCSSMTITADQFSTTSVSIICATPSSCKGLQFHGNGISRAELHCVQTDSCQGAIITLDEISSQNNSHTSVSCYTQSSCDGLIIYADGAYTRLLMYEYSSNVQLYNTVGFLSDLQTVSCGLHGKYIQYTPSNTTKSMQDLMNEEYPLSLLPCQDVTVICEANNNNGSCSMGYKLHPEYIEHNEKFIASNAECIYVELSDIVSLHCEGICQVSPTKAPTMTPTYNPSVSPTYSPTLTPTYDPTIAPSIAPILSPTIAPTQYPTAAPTKYPSIAPTASPTQSPSRLPITKYVTFDMKMDIVYIFNNLTLHNYRFILNYSQNNAIQDMEQIIEENYFDHLQLPNYKLYQVRFHKFNGRKKDKLKLASEIIYLENKDNLYVASVVLFTAGFSNYMVKTSQNILWQLSVTRSFRQYFDNPGFTFSVANSSNLQAVSLDKAGFNKDMIFWIITISLLSCICFWIVVSRCTIMYKMQFCLPVDSVDWFSLILLGLAIYDVVTNISLAIEIFNHNHETHVSTITVCGIIIVSFIVFRFILNVYYAIKMKQIIAYNMRAKEWYEDYTTRYMFFIILSGGNTYPMLKVCSSNLFGVEFTRSGISSLELHELYFANNSVLSVALFIQCIPHLVSQLLYFIFTNGHISQTLLLAFCSTLLFTLIYVICIIINCYNSRNLTDTMNVFYYIEVKLKAHFGRILTSIRSKERKHIKRRKGLKSELTKQFIDLYSHQIINITKTFEVGNVTVRRKGFFIRFIQRLNRMDLLSDANEDNVYNVNAGLNELEQEFKTYCNDLFTSKKDAIYDILLNHFSELNADKFEIKYHKEYPPDASLREHPSHISAPSNSFDDHEEGETDVDFTDNNNVNISNNANTSTHAQQQIDEHRKQFKKAMKLISQEDKNKRNDYNHLMFLFKANDINYAVIDDVFEFAAQIGLIRPRALSDIDNSDDNMTNNMNNIGNAGVAGIGGYNYSFMVNDGFVDGENEAHVQNKGAIQMQPIIR